MIYEVSGRRSMGGELFHLRVYALTRKRALLKTLQNRSIPPLAFGSVFDPGLDLEAIYVNRLGSKWYDRVFISAWREVAERDLRRLLQLSLLEALELAMDDVKRRRAIAGLAADKEAALEALVLAPVAPGARSRISPLGQ